MHGDVNPFGVFEAIVPLSEGQEDAEFCNVANSLWT